MKNIITSLSLILVLALSGCDINSFLDEKYVPEVLWQKVDQLEYTVNVPYAAVNRSWSNVNAIYNYYDYVVSGLAQPTGLQGNGANFDEIYERRHRDLANPEDFWMGKSYMPLYNAIAASNDLLGFLASDDPEVLFPKDTKEYIDANVPRVKAEMYFWRAYAYYYLALYYTPPYSPGGDNSKRVLPYKTDIYSPENTKIGTTQEVWDLITSDLLAAKELMPENWYKEGRINYNTIAGLLARVYFYTGKHDLAEAECTNVIGHKDEAKFLAEDVMDAWTRTIGDPEPEEVIYSVEPSEVTLSGTYTVSSILTKNNYQTDGGGRYSDSTRWSQSGWVSTIMSNQFLQKIGWMGERTLMDGSVDQFGETELALADKRYGNTWIRLEEYHPKVREGETPSDEYESMAYFFLRSGDPNVYIVSTGNDTTTVTRAELFNGYETKNSTLDFPHVYCDKYYRGPSAYTTRHPVMRLPEFYLTRAAIRFSTGNTGGAMDDVNIVRQRAGLDPLTSIVEDDIEREWIIEFGGEGLYLGYLMAMRKPIPAGDRNVEPFMPPYRTWYWKIPQAELDYNQGYGDYNPNLD